MLDSINVGPPLVGAARGQPPLMEARSGPPSERSDSFSQALQGKMRAKSAPPSKDGGTSVKERDDRAEDPVEAAIQKMEPMKGKSATLRERAIRKFMDSAESELGIPPMDIVAAMAQLDPQKLAAAPEKTIQDVVQGLNLPPQAEGKMTELYSELVQELGQLRQEKPLPLMRSDAGLMASPLVLERFRAAQDRKASVLAGVDQMNDRFWVRPDLEAPVERMVTPEAVIPMEARALEDTGAWEAWTPNEIPMTEMPIESEIPVRDPRMPLPQPTMAQRRAIGTYQEMDASLQAPVIPVVETANAMPKTDVALETAQQQVPMTPEMLMRQLQGDTQGQSESFGQDSRETLTQMARTGKKDASAENTFVGALGIPTAGSELKSAEAPLPAAPMTPVANTEKDVNVQALLKQAQYLVKKGGGEMKVQMSPEGLGQVQLHVLVKDGKVNVQMAAETNEAKKAIESSLADLRSNLSAHKLSVDQMKIDVVSGPNTDTQTRNDSSQQNPQQQRDLRQFWNNFQENFGNRQQRDGFTELPDMRGYRRHRTPPALEPLSETQTARRGPVSENKGRGLDMVA